MAFVPLSGGTMAGSTSLNATGLRLKMVFSGRCLGQTLLSDTFREELTGTTIGGSALSTPSLHLRKSLFGTVEGHTQLGDSSPLRHVGSTTLAAVCQVVRTTVVACPCKMTGTVLRFGSVLTPQDLAITISSGHQPVAAYSVEYRLFQVRKDGTRFQVGGTHTPGMLNPGLYYATWIAGRGGQPGQWQIEWSYRKTFNSPAQIETYGFEVVDSTLKPLTGDLTYRVKKYGWGD